MSIKTTAGLIGLLLCMPLSTAAEEKPTEDTFPYHIKLFDVPEQYKDAFDNYRKRWTRLTGFEYSGLHWEQFISVYTFLGEQSYRHNYLEFITWFEDPDEEANEPQYINYPEGTMLLKENFSVKEGKPGDAVSVTAMIKHAPGYDSGNGDWEYLQFDPQGKILLNGNSRDEKVFESCAKCHGNVADRDYVFSQMHSTLRR